jgi:hypothetical protein
MDLKSLNLKKIGRLRSPNLKIAEWLEKRLVIGKYSYSRKIILVAVLIVVFLSAVIVFSVIAYRASHTDPGAAAQKEIKKLISHIGGFMELPAGEQPTLATVADQEKLKGQDFFSHAQNGDKLLIYPKAKKAILYRPSTGKIIEVTNLTSGSQPVPVVPPETNP